jgi:hypothetical protein
MSDYESAKGSRSNPDFAQTPGLGPRQNAPMSARLRSIGALSPLSGVRSATAQPMRVQCARMTSIRGPTWWDVSSGVSWEHLVGHQRRRNSRARTGDVPPLLVQRLAVARFSLLHAWTDSSSIEWLADTNHGTRRHGKGGRRIGFAATTRPRHEIEGNVVISRLDAEMLDSISIFSAWNASN